MPTAMTTAATRPGRLNAFAILPVTSEPARYTANEITQAMPHCKSTISSAARAPPCSLRTVAMAATHGVYSSTNAKNAMAVTGVNNMVRSTPSPMTCVNVDTTLSFAMKPVMRAVAARQSPKPSGANSGAISPPMPASRLASTSSTTFRRASNVCKNQMTTHAASTTVNAFFTKPFALSHTRRATLFAAGRR